MSAERTPGKFKFNEKLKSYKGIRLWVSFCAIWNVSKGLKYMKESHCIKSLNRAIGITLFAFGT